VNNEILSKKQEEDELINEWESLKSLGLSAEERSAKIRQVIAERATKHPHTEVEKKTLSEEYRDKLGEMAERDGTNYEVVKNGMDILIKYGGDSVRMTLHANAKVGDRSPIHGYLTVSPEDVAKAWFQEMIATVGGDVRVEK
jgi:hypothetical protein